MKKNLIRMACVFLMFLLFIGFSSCSVKHIHSNPNGIPPGQAKKITGSQSAKPYAPGQQNK